MKKPFALLTGVVLMALWASPAFAMTGTTITAPAGEVRGIVTIKVTSNPDSGLLTSEKIAVTVTVTAPEGGQGLGQMTLTSTSPSTFEGSWDTTKSVINGAYKIDAVASSSSLLGNKSETDTATVNVANPPATPTGVKSALKEGVPVVTWTANKEADIAGYKVLRSEDGAAAKQVAAPAETSFTDRSAPHSKALTYRVVAVRKGGSGGVESGPSAATAAVTVPAPPPAEPGAQPAGDPNRPVVPGTNIVTGKAAPPAAPLLPNKGFGKAIAPIVKAAPPGTAFDETLPYSGVPPEQFDTAGGGEPAPIDADGTGDGTTVANPMKFIVGGLLLAAASFFLWRYSRKLLKSTRVQDPKLPSVNYPSFRINRG